MENFNNSDIEPNQGIGPFYIGMPESELYSLIPQNSPKRKIGNLYTVNYGSFTLWVNKENKSLKQIGVSNNFSGKLLGKIKLGSTVKEIKKQNIAVSVCNDMQLILTEYPGVSLHTNPAINDLNPDPKDSSIIESIYVYKQ